MRVWLSIWLASVALALALGAPSLDLPGPYYDEAIQAGPARDFVAGSALGLHAPGLESRSVGGRPFPWKTQPYMGALKSLLLIPVFAVTGPELSALRWTTFVWALLGLGFAVRWAQLAFGPGTALWMGLLLASDASFLFVSRHDWGSFALGFAARSAGLLLLLLAWRRRSLGLAFAGGVAFGVCLWNKVDAGAFLLAAGLGIVASEGPGIVRRILTDDRRFLAAGCAGLALGAFPLVPFLGGLAAGVGVVAQRGDLTEALLTLWQVLDGSHFARLVEAGGLFDRVGSADGRPGLLAIAFVAAAPALTAGAWPNPASTLPGGRGARFALISAVGTLLLVLAIPGAGRLHHFMNAYPMPHLVVAIVATWAWRAAAGRTALRALCAVAIAAVVASGAAASLTTRATFERTGGKGRFAADLVPAIERLSGTGARVVSLDWGFHEQLLFLGRPPLRPIEPIWRASAARSTGRSVELRGSADDVYLLHEAHYDLFGFGPAFLARVDALPEEVATLTRHRDREGEVTFVEVRLHVPHRLVLGAGVKLELAGGG